jgi:hypothetical protein
MYENQLALEAALMEVVLWVEQRGSSDFGENMRSSLELIGENAGHIKKKAWPSWLYSAVVTPERQMERLMANRWFSLLR